jgi:hypothetical protein
VTFDVGISLGKSTNVNITKVHNFDVIEEIWQLIMKSEPNEIPTSNVTPLTDTSTLPLPDMLQKSNLFYLILVISVLLILSHN